MMSRELELELRGEELRMETRIESLKAQLINLGLEIHQTQKRLLKNNLSDGARKLTEIKLGMLKTKYNDIYHLITD